MKRFARPLDALKNGGFSIHYYVGRWTTKSFVAESWILAGLSAVAVLAAATLDQTFFLPGRDVGLLEHPAIWAFITLQVVLPLSIRRSLEKVSGVNASGQTVAPNEHFLKMIQDRFVEALQLQTTPGKLITAICYTTGFAAFAWNSYQNQLPGILLPYDFWDSSNHLFGYWITRVYKFYLFVWLLPYVALIHSAILIATLGVIRERRLSGLLELQPFHPDGVGGLGFVPGLVTTPIIATLLVAAIPVAAAFEVHRAIDATHVMGAVIVIGGALIAYVVPILYLRADILAMKRSTVEKLRRLQQSYYERIIAGEKLGPQILRQGNEALEYFEKICNRVSNISNYPHLVRLLRYVGLALTPSIASFVLKLYETFGPALIPLLKRI